MKTNVILKAAVVAALGVSSMGAFAGTGATATNASVSTFATQAVPATGAVTINAGVTYNVATGGVATTEGGLITFTLPAGVTFVTTPTLTGDGTVFGAAPTVAGGGAGSNFITVNVSKTTSTATTGSVALGAFQITGATALASPTASGAFRVAAQASGFVTNTTLNDAAPVYADLALSASALGVAVATNNVTIDVANVTNPAVNYVAGGNTIARAANVGTITPSLVATRNAANTAAYGFTATTASAVITADLTGISGVYAVTPNAACAATAPAGAKVATLAANTATITGLAPGSAYGICFINDNTSLLRSTPSGVTAVVSQDSTSSPTQTLGTITYNGTVTSLNYVIGSTSGGYLNYIRVTNPTGVAAKVIAVVTTDAGVTKTGTLAEALAAGNNALYSVTDLNTATGSNLSSANDRARVTILSPQAITASNLMFNPDGTVVTMP